MKATLPPSDVAGGARPHQPLDHVLLEANLKALAYSVRLRLLSLLHTPRTLDELHVPVGAEDEGRPISRQAVKAHLDQLLALGLVDARMVRRPGRRPATEFAVVQPRLWALVEEFSRLATLGRGAVTDPLTTQVLEPSDGPEWEPGPKLVLVHGAYAGAAYPLRTADLEGGRGWIVGRDETAHVPLVYDPYASAENCEILRTPQGFRLVDLRPAVNGTSLNWQRLGTGGEAPLQHGDVVGVGRSLLVFRTD